MIYYVDIDGTICSTTNGNYKLAKPYPHRIEHINQLFDSGHEVHYWTARGGHSGKDYTKLTEQQLEEWGCKYTQLHMKKPSYDIFIDDKALSDVEYFKCTL